MMMMSLPLDPPQFSPDFMLIPTVCLLGWILAITYLKDDKSFWVRLLAMVPMVFICGRYLAWRLTDTIVWGSGDISTVVGLLVVVAELYAFFVNTFSSWTLFLMKTNRTPQADNMQVAVYDGTFAPIVDVFIATVNEPEIILRRTVTGCLNMNYPHKQIWLLDDGRRAWVKALAEELGVGYFDRADNKHFKAGNVNNALRQTSNEFIAFFDADFVPTPQFLHRVMGFFQDETIALVQTPQSFYNPDLVEMNLGIQRGLTNEQDLFFRGIQPGRDFFNAVICCGTSFVVRRAPLEALGGMPTETITEDLMTSVYLQADGYEVVYLNEALSFGEAPNRSVDHLKQRIRWARGILQTLYTAVNPLTCKGLNIFQRYFHLIGSLYWTTFPARLFLMMLPLAYMLFSIQTMNATTDTMLSYFLPYYIGSVTLFSWFNRGRRSPFWSEVYEFIPIFALIPNVFATFIDPFGLGFKVTPKGVTTSKIMPNWDVIIPCLVVIGLHTYGLLRLSTMWSWEAGNPAIMLNLVWSLYAMLIFWMVCLACVDVPQKRKDIRFDQQWQATLQLGNYSLNVITADISESAARLSLSQQDIRALKNEATETARLSFPEMGIVHIPVELRVLAGGGRKGLSLLCLWEPLPQAQYALLLRHMILKLEAGWEDRKVSEWYFAWQFLKSPLRMHSLASSS
jgi:cellulose synthase (UDP-forming)